MTILVALTGRPAVGLMPRCRAMLTAPDEPAAWPAACQPDATAGAWPPRVASALAAAAAGLTAPYPDERPPLPAVLGRFEALLGVPDAPRDAPDAPGSPAAAAAQVAHAVAPRPPPSPVAPPAPAPASALQLALPPTLPPAAPPPTPPPTPCDLEACEACAMTVERLCIVCEERPRSVRFACGHALACAVCLPRVVARGACPTCGTPFGAAPVAERGDHVRVAPTFVLPARSGAALCGAEAADEALAGLNAMRNAMAAVAAGGQR